MNESSYNWKKFLLLLSARVISAFDRLTRPERVKVLVLDDSVIARNRSKKVELLARVYDHVDHKFKKGFILLTLGWSDGYRTHKESMMHKTDAAIRLIKNALNAGIKAQYVLMDTWFTTEPMIGAVLNNEWIGTQASFIQALFGNIRWES